MPRMGDPGNKSMDLLPDSKLGDFTGGGGKPGRTAKPECKTFVHFMMRPFRPVILSAAKNLTPRPFAALRVTILVYQFYAVRFSTVSAHLLGNRAFFLPLPKGEGNDHSARRQSTLIQLCSPPARPQRTATTSRLARQSRTARRRVGTRLAASTKHSGRSRLTP